MHLQPIFSGTDYIGRDGIMIPDENGMYANSVSDDIIDRGLCLPSDNKMTKYEQNRIIEVVKACFS